MLKKNIKKIIIKKYSRVAYFFLVISCLIIILFAYYFSGRN